MEITLRSVPHNQTRTEPVSMSIIPVTVERKRCSESFDVRTGAKRLSKRRNGSKALFVNDYEDICLGMSELKHEQLREDPLSDFDVFLDAFIELNVEQRNVWTRPVEALLDLEWHSTLTVLDRAHTPIRRALDLCTSCGIERFRDVLWYNKTLKQAAGLRRFPICLVDTAYQLKDWYPRKLKPMVPIETWRNAWIALARIWPLLCLALPPELRQVLVVRKYSLPPESANWFEFNYFDGVYSRMEPLLCYHEEELDTTTNTIEAEPSARQTGIIQDVSVSKDGNLSDDDPRRDRIDGPDSDSEED